MPWIFRRGLREGAVSGAEFRLLSAQNLLNLTRVSNTTHLGDDDAMETGYNGFVLPTEFSYLFQQACV